MRILLLWRWKGITKSWNTEPRMQRPQANRMVSTFLASVRTDVTAGHGRRRLLQSLGRIRS